MLATTRWKVPSRGLGGNLQVQAHRVVGGVVGSGFDGLLVDVDASDFTGPQLDRGDGQDAGSLQP